MLFNMVFMYKIGIKYQYVSHAVCSYAHLFQERPRCALIGACALIRTNTVANKYPLNKNKQIYHAYLRISKQMKWRAFSEPFHLFTIYCQGAKLLRPIPIQY